MSTENPVPGAETETCPQCGWGLAPDQRYCVNCGWRRGGPRVDYETQMMGRRQPATAAGPATAAPAQQWTPAFAILAIALLGVMLLLGVLIGKKDDNGTTQTVQAQAPATTTTASAPTDTTATTASNKGNKAGKAAAGTAPGQGNVVQGGSGSANGIQSANTNASPEQNAKSGPDVVATQGTPEKLDPNGQAGGGSSGTCIGC
jgi:hypothetical protein